MVNRPKKMTVRRFTVLEMVVAVSILVLAMVPLAYGFARKFRAMKTAYYTSVAEQVLDGHREILARGDWRNHPVGKSVYTIKNEAFESLPDGETTLEIRRDGAPVKITLKWVSPQAGTVVKHGEFVP